MKNRDTPVHTSPCLIASASMLALSACSTLPADCRVVSGYEPASHLAGPTGPGADAGAGGYATERDTAADIAPCRAG